MKVKALKLPLFFALGDIFVLCFSFVLSYRWIYKSVDISEKHLFFFVILCLSWLLVGSFFKLFDYYRASRTEIILSNFFKAFIVNGFMIAALLYTLKSNSFSSDYLYVTLFLAFISIIIWRSISFVLIKNYIKLGYNYKNVVIIGTGDVLAGLISSLVGDKKMNPIQAASAGVWIHSKTAIKLKKGLIAEDLIKNLKKTITNMYGRYSK